MKRFSQAFRLIVLVFLMTAANTALALNSDLALPDKASSSHKACREIIRLGEKYKIEGLFSKEFTEGQCQLDRLEIAIAVQLLTEKMAEKAEREGADVIDRKDLAFLREMDEELREEMLLARSRAYQSRYHELSSNLHALTRNITMGGGMVGVLQGSFNNEPRNHSEVVGRGDLVFNFRITDSTIAVVDVEATGGDGLDARIANYSVLNGVAGTTDDRVRFREAWVEQSLFSEKLVMTIGKIDLTNYFDANAVANDENGQFLGGAFVNSAILGAPGNGPGIRMTGMLGDLITLGFGYGSGDEDGSGIFDNGFGMGEVDFKLMSGDLEGNFRAYVTLDGTEADGEMKLKDKGAFGYGLSVDQQITDKLTLFGRFGWRDHNTYATKCAWSAGFQYSGLIPQRKDDVAGFAFGQVLANNATAQEKLLEAYYKLQITDQIALSPHFQYLINPLGDKDARNVVVLGMRTQITF